MIESTMYSDFDRTAMQRALELAARGLATTHPNPRVGCVIARNGRIVGEGWHARAGEAHAEVAALAAAGSEAAGATAYVTLEPCNHQGRTPPCVDALLAARIARVVYALPDPNPRVAGGGGARLEAAGVRVAAGLLAAEAAELNAGFLRRMRTGRPWVRVKLAMSLDGRTALASGASRWVSGEAARADVQHWRARSAAILTGVGTVLADDPRLDVRLADAPAAAPRPLRVVLDSTLRTPPAARLFTVPGEVLIITALGASDARWSRAAPRSPRTARASRRCPPRRRACRSPRCSSAWASSRSTSCRSRPARPSPGSCCGRGCATSCCCTWRRSCSDPPPGRCWRSRSLRASRRRRNCESRKSRE